MKNKMMEKMAKKAFESAAFQKSWQVHAKAFSPLLDTAFEHSYVARVHLTDALNHLSRQEVKPAADKLKILQEACQTDADHAAWFFFMGLCLEMIGRHYDMCTFYRRANAYNHGYYLPYLKVAKAAYDDDMYSIAAGQYAIAAELLEKREEKEFAPALAAAYLGCAACHIMMHHMQEAETFLQRSEEKAPDLPGRSAIAAIFHALRQETEKTNQMLEQARQEGKLPPETESMVDDIRKGIHPHFFAQPVNEKRIPLFWKWMGEQRETIVQMIADDREEEVFRMMSPQILSLFPVGMEEADFGVFMDEQGLNVIFCHGFSRTQEKGYEALLAACPAELEEGCAFTIEA